MEIVKPFVRYERHLACAILNYWYVCKNLTISRISTNISNFIYSISKALQVIPNIENIKIRSYQKFMHKYLLCTANVHMLFS